MSHVKQGLDLLQEQEAAEKERTEREARNVGSLSHLLKLSISTFTKLFPSNIVFILFDTLPFIFQCIDQDYRLGHGFKGQAS